MTGHLDGQRSEAAIAKALECGQDGGAEEKGNRGKS